MVDTNQSNDANGWIGWILILFTIAAIVVAMSAERRNNAIEMNAQELIGYFVMSESSAERYFEGRPVAMQGVVEHIIEQGEDVTITFSGGEDLAVYGIACEMSSQTELTEIMPGDALFLIGTCDGIDDYEIRLSDCVVR